ncbi:dirigent protein 22-like [Salvia miltiorrhiza]|uniref:dirigent protein 22-like n=1 Tax=Salvia miltiorrhiza TaxID=226208 RepID=UPI0025ACCAD9|nr:dirigent protein 22-like [Salvia miltiorrhiza]
MAKLSNIALISLISCLFVSTLDAYATNVKGKTFLRRIRGEKEKVVKLTFYVQDLRVGNPNPIVYEVASASVTSSSPTSFGSVHVVDDLLTEKPAYGSRAVGRVQGLTTSADLSVNAVAINLNFYFTTGRFNGSTISVLGRNPVAEAQRELPVVGGTGAFRYARGYAVTSNTYNDAETHYSVLQYTIYTTYNAKLNESDDAEVDEM